MSQLKLLAVQPMEYLSESALDMTPPAAKPVTI